MDAPPSSSSSPSHTSSPPPEEEQEDPRERQHLQEVILSFLEYSKYQGDEVERRWERLCKLPPHLAATLPPNSLVTALHAQRSAVCTNQAFLEVVLQGVEDINPSGKSLLDATFPLLKRHQAQSQKPLTTPANMAKIKATLHSCFREWSADGAPERTACFGPLLEELQQRLSAKDASTGRKHRVLVPGAGLGRLPLEIAARGYACQGNEFSYHMLLTSNFLLNCTAETEGIPIAPFIDQTCNLWRGGDNSKTVCIPDVCPGQLLGIPLEGSAGEHDGGDPPDFSMVAGDFQDVYAPPQGCCWDAVVSCFFLDTAPVALEYVETIHRLLKPNGLWINLGPLLYHWAGGSDAGEDARYARSVELGWEEVRHAMVEGFGFELLREDVQRNVTYASNPGSMMRTVYDCVLCTARKSDHGSAREMGKNGEA